MRKKIDETKPLIYCSDQDNRDVEHMVNFCGYSGDCEHLVRNYTEEEDNDEAKKED